MQFFKKYFGDNHHMNDQGEMFVCCPFPHIDDKGIEYLETRPSAHINTHESIFHCKVCGEGMSEPKFMMQVQGISYREALQLLEELNDGHYDWINERQNFLNNAAPQELWQGLGLPLDLADILKIGYQGQGISFPVFVYDELLDVRNYVPGRDPKVISEKGAKPLIYPFDLWREDENPTLLCAGEKDMAIARANGFNAITFTGGEQAFPKLFKASFRGKKVYIVYDNDAAGQQGSRKVAMLLKDCGATPHVVTGHYAVCTEKGEDIHDFFQKYHKTATDLQTILDQTPEFSEDDFEKERVKHIPLVTLEESTQGQYSNRFVSSRVQTVATYEEVFLVPEYVEFTKFGEPNSTDVMEEGEVRTWALDDDTLKDLLLLMDSNLKEKDMINNLKHLVHIPRNESQLRISQRSKLNIFKAVVTDDTEREIVAGEEGVKPRELLIYSVGQPLGDGKRYRMTYKPVPHPMKGMQIVGIVNRLEASDNSVDSFKVTPSVLESLKCFQVQPNQSVKEKMDEIAERAKGFCGVETRKEIAFTVDLFYHTPLFFQFGRRVEKGILDIFLVGESRTGKSQTAKKMLEKYELGIFTSLKTATTAGLIGGSDQTGGGWKTKLGVIPRNHKGAIILEEFSGGGRDFISQLTDIRSSGKVRITRVNGSRTFDAMVRMLSISNQATGASGMSIPLRQYPNGIQVLLDLIGAAEDIARYDFFLLVDEPTGYISPLDDFDLEPFDKQSYLNRVRWIWSRNPEQITMTDDTKRYIVSVAEELNKNYNSHIKFFGAEAWKKLARVAVACASCVCSIDETGENLVVKQEHVQWAKNFLIACYDNQLFKLKEYVLEQRRYSECDGAAVAALQGIYNSHKTMLLQLEMATDMTQKQLQAVSGLDQKEFAKTVNHMAGCFFIRFQGERIQPTQRFRTAMQQITRSVYVPRIGEDE